MTDSFDLIVVGARTFGIDVEGASVAEVIHPHPTLSEAVGEAVLGAAGKPLHGG